MKQEKEMQEIKGYCTRRQQIGALCLLQPVQGAVIRLNAKQSSHVLTTNVKYNGELEITYKMIKKPINSTTFKDTLFIGRKQTTLTRSMLFNQLFKKTRESSVSPDLGNCHRVHSIWRIWLLDSCF